MGISAAFKEKYNAACDAIQALTDLAKDNVAPCQLNDVAEHESRAFEILTDLYANFLDCRKSCKRCRLILGKYGCEKAEVTEI